MFRSAVSLTERIASEKRDHGCSETIQQTLPSRAIDLCPSKEFASVFSTLDASPTNGTTATQGVLSTFLHLSGGGENAVHHLAYETKPCAEATKTRQSEDKSILRSTLF